MEDHTNCVFCKIVRGEVPSEKILETPDFLVFLDINPRSAGHALVIPHKHHRWVWDVPQYAEYFETARTIARAQQKAFNTEAILLRVAGEEVPHAHIWVMPNPDFLSADLDKKDLKGNAEKIRAALTALAAP